MNVLDWFIPMITAVGGVLAALIGLWIKLRVDGTKASADKDRSISDGFNSIIEGWKSRAEAAEAREKQTMHALQSITPELQGVYAKYAEVVKELGELRVKTQHYDAVLITLAVQLERLGKWLDEQADADPVLTEQVESMKATIGSGGSNVP